MSIELISFKTCPFVQRAVITLRHKKIHFKITHIDLADPPEWFLEISPLGKVPVLRIDNEILFESAVINEYLDDISGASMQPKDPLERARNRSWIEYASNMLGNLYMMKMAKDESDYVKFRDRLTELVERLEKRIGDGPWFNGNEFSLADSAFAPFFRQNSVADYQLSIIDPETTPRVDAWSKRLLALPEVAGSVVDDFDQLYLAAMEKNGSYSLNLLAS